MIWKQALGSTAAVSVGSIIVGADWRHWMVLGVGLGIGIMARWAMVLSLNQRLGWRELRIDALVILANGLLAAQFAEFFNLSGIRLAVAAAMFGASSTMIFSKMHAAFATRVGLANMGLPLDASIEVPAGPGVPEVVTVAVTPGTPMRRELRKAFEVQQPNDELDALLDKLKDT